MRALYAGGAAALRRRSPAVRLRDGRRGQRARLALRGRHLLRHAGRARRRRRLPAPLRLPRRDRRAAGRRRPRGARPPHGRGQPPAARARQRAHDAGRPARRAPATRCSRPGPSFRDLTRIAGSNRRVWTDIFLENRAALLAALATFQEGLQEVLEALAANDAERLGDAIGARRRAARAHARRRQPAGARAAPPHRARPRPARACSARSWSRSATPASTSRTSPCTT